MSESEKLLIKQRAVFTVIISENGRIFLGICQVILAKKIGFFWEITICAEENVTK